MNDQKIDLIDVFNFLRSNALLLTAFVMLGAASGLIAFHYQPYKWRADATLQVGKIPVMGKMEYLDTPQELAEKAKSPSFLSQMLTILYGNNVSPDSPTGDILLKETQVLVGSSAGLITLRVSGWTPAEAYRNVGTVAGQIVAQSTERAKPYLDELARHLSEVEASIARNKDVLDKIEVIEQRAPARNEANMLLKIALMDAKANELEKLKAEQSRLQSLLAIARLQQTGIVGHSLIPRDPESPHRKPLVIGGAFGGLLIGVFVAFLRVLLQTRKKVRAPL